MSTSNIGRNEVFNDDFTEESYRGLLRLALRSYAPTTYRNIAWRTKFVLFRHDCDLSLNRAHAIAQIEAEEGVQSTFFINPHCKYYNFLELSQLNLIKKILDLGHDIGLHFDSEFYGADSEVVLGDQVQREADFIKQVLGVRPAAFSFHNPTALHLSFEQEFYGGLINCYSGRFKSQVPYCSDSNGCWRHRRLYSVLEEAVDPCLQVLTHPDWWQEKQMPPRQRVFRSVYGRAHAVMKFYDMGLEAHGRKNLAGSADNLKFLEEIDAAYYQLCDYLWNSRMLESLIIELYRLHERQIRQLCKTMFNKAWEVPVRDVDAFFGDFPCAVEGWRLFEAAFEKSWVEASGCPEAEHRNWVKICGQLFHESLHISSDKLEEGCVYFCTIVDRIAKWGDAREAIGYDGIAHLVNSDEQVKEVGGDVDSSHSKKWEEFKFNLQGIRKD